MRSLRLEYPWGTYTKLFGQRPDWPGGTFGAADDFAPVYVMAARVQVVKPAAGEGLAARLRALWRLLGPFGGWGA